MGKDPEDLFTHSQTNMDFKPRGISGKKKETLKEPEISDYGDEVLKANQDGPPRNVTLDS